MRRYGTSEAFTPASREGCSLAPWACFTPSTNAAATARAAAAGAPAGPGGSSAKYGASSRSSSRSWASCSASNRARQSVGSF